MDVFSRFGKKNYLLTMATTMLFILTAFATVNFIPEIEGDEGGEDVELLATRAGRLSGGASFA
ncbi:MAG: hypothetical protein KAH57_04380, partial [Thermoplasmata archaeon]|nr:hypothetical protein [Thermoplasmata archaeon]